MKYKCTLSLLICVLIISGLANGQTFNNYLDKRSENTYTVIGDEADTLINPVDLDFYNSSDLDIYAKVGNPVKRGGPNGSHLDMIHKSPFGMGTAHEEDNVYWVFDGHHGNICRYEFGNLHKPGGEDHSDGKVKRYTELKVNMEGNLPSHMVMDEDKEWLYINDVGNERILRLKANSGDIKGPLSPRYYEGLDQYVEMENVTWEVYIDQNLVDPCGIEIYGDHLLVTDNATNEIIFYDISGNTPRELGRLKPDPVKVSSIMGITVGPYGRIFFVDDQQKKVFRIDNENVIATGIKAVDAYNEPELRIFPNPSDGMITVANNGIKGAQQVKIFSPKGRQVFTQKVNFNERAELNLSHLQQGFYILQIQTPGSRLTEKIFIR